VAVVLCSDEQQEDKVWQAGRYQVAKAGHKTISWMIFPCINTNRTKEKINDKRASAK